MRFKLAIAAVMLASLVGCGGGGGGSSGSGSDSASCTPTMANPQACNATMSLVLVDGAGAALAQLSPDRAGTLVATVKNWDGKPVVNTVVSFSTTDQVKLVPASGTATTDANGVARIGLPAGANAGGFSATASASVKGSVLSASTSYAVKFPQLALSALVPEPARLQAGGNASISVSVTSDGQPYTAPLQVSFTSPCVSAGKAAIGSPVTTQNGVARASYSDRGCGVRDVITAAVTLGDTTVTQTGAIDVLPAAPGSLTFVASDTTNIALVGTGGAGRQEFATLRFRLFDTTGNPVSGTAVDFAFADREGAQASTTGGLRFNPASATSSADGTVTTLVTGGTIPTSVRVKATVRGTNPAISTLSNVLVVSTGVPVQSRFSLSTAIGNCEGWDYDQDECSIVTAQLADHFGNPAPDGTAVNFTTEGGNIQASCITGQLLESTTPLGQSTNSRQGPGSGMCSVKLRSANPRPTEPYIAPADVEPGKFSRRGRITVMAYALGEEDFHDDNGNNRCDNCDDLTGPEFLRPGVRTDVPKGHDLPRDIYRDDDESGTYTGGEPCVGPNASGRCNTPGDGKYNGVLRSPLQSGAAPTLYVSDQLVQFFSGREANFEFLSDKFTCPVGGAMTVRFHARDLNGNPMPAGSTIRVSALFGVVSAPVAPAEIKVNNYVLKVGNPTPQPVYEFVVGCPSSGSGRLMVELTTPVSKTTTTATRPINN